MKQIYFTIRKFNKKDPDERDLVTLKLEIPFFPSKNEDSFLEKLEDIFYNEYSDGEKCESFIEVRTIK